MGSDGLEDPTWPSKYGSRCDMVMSGVICGPMSPLAPHPCLLLRYSMFLHCYNMYEMIYLQRVKACFSWFQVALA